MNILCVHQGYELYGSDRSFLQSIQAMKKRWPEAYVTAIIPQHGPITEPLKKVADTVRAEALWVPRKNRLAKLFLIDAWRFPFAVLRARRVIRENDLVYINTLTILNYNVAARLAGRPAILHVREIAGKKSGALFAAVLRFSRAVIVFNSHATARAFRLPSKQRTHVVHNGIGEIMGATPPQPSGTLKLLTLGRFNSWKGQDVLVDAVALLSGQERAKLELRLVGGVFEDQRHFTDAIESKIKASGLENCVRMLPFTDQPEEHYAWADVVAVPSKKPEPFGRVAAEAMAHARPVLAADHGGLSEIVEHGASGWLVEPGNAEALAAALRDILGDLPRVQTMGDNARRRFLRYFSEAQYMDNIARICAEAMGER